MKPNENLPQKPPAGFWIRFLAYLVDAALLNLVATLAMTILLRLGLFGGVSIALILNKYFMPAGSSEDALGLLFTAIAGGMLVALIGSMIFLIILLLFYGALFEASPMQSTPGKLFLGLIVVDKQGCRIGIIRAFCRNFSKIISYMTFLIGFIIAAIPPKKRALHDRLAGAAVVRVKETPIHHIAIAIIFIVAVNMLTTSADRPDEDPDVHKSQQHVEEQKGFRFNFGKVTSSQKTSKNTESDPVPNTLVRYTDSSGVTHYVSSIERVPKKYLNRVEQDFSLPELGRF